ncbi:MAG: CocE/NonD family hydrolase [Alphaproteobacteria bacterium]|nr:CocE/NonD family hydrolase [Alphaproteobacteria bacterium]NNF24316.1 CocE/NonD family hydrolase [Paracoccaceae bacterium]
MRTVSRFPHKVIETPDMEIRLSDGCRLSARVWMPQDAQQHPVPAILEYLPYRKRDGTAVRDALTHPYFAGHGYACLRVDMRGNGDSEGVMEDEYTAQELADACEVISWIAEQDWCSGRVGMMGISWGGFNGLQVAALQPEPLKAVISLCSTVDRYADDIHYKGGCLLNENLGWGATMWAYSSRPPDPALRENWRAMWLERLEAEPFQPSVWLRHQLRNAYWRHGSVCENYSAIKARVLAIGGWGDAYKNAVPALVAGAAAHGIVGPWVHKYPHFAAPEPRIGFLQEALRWWDKWLKDAPTEAGADPTYRAYLMDGVRPASWYDHRPGRWVALEAVPAAADGVTLDFGAGTLGEAQPFETPIASPQHCGMAAGEFCAIWLGPEMPGDQRGDDVLSACFDSAPMPRAAIVGAPVVRLRLASDTPVAQVAVRLCHVHPDGASTRITWGVLNLTHLAGHERSEPLEPGRVFEAKLTLDHIAYLLPQGHRLRVAVSSAYWPMIWPSPEPVTLTLTGGSLSLPLLPQDASDWSFEGAEAAPALQQREIRPPGHVRRTEIDQQTGLVSLIVEDDFGLAENLEHGLISGSVARERWDIHPGDPLSARGRCHWTEELAREGWCVRTETTSQMWSDATHFHLRARLEAYDGDALIYARDVEDTIPRQGI